MSDDVSREAAIDELVLRAHAQSLVASGLDQGRVLDELLAIVGDAWSDAQDFMSFLQDGERS